MKILEYTISFSTPAFLGNAEQSGQWRTPPIKALLRQWWRVAYASEKKFNVDVAAMRHEEGLLFGKAVDDQSCKSRVRLRLDRWDEGRLTRWESIPTRVHHPEVGNNGNGMQIGPDLYLGYGPLTFQGGQVRLKKNAAVQFGESAKLSIAVPDRDADRVIQALKLMDRYGTLGGRSRNGWGSFRLIPQPDGTQTQNTLPTRDWKECMKLDWPHAIGSDTQGPLIWQIKSTANDWKTIMTELAKMKIALRRQFRFPHEKSDGHVHSRHWLSYPVTNHRVKAWGDNRLPNTLRFKVRPVGDSNQYQGFIFSVPHSPPADFRPNQQTLINIWQQAHDHLDTRPDLNRSPF